MNVDVDVYVDVDVNVGVNANACDRGEMRGKRGDVRRGI